MSLLTFEDLVAVKYTGCVDMDAIDEERFPRAVKMEVGVVAALPPMKYHQGPLHFLSKPLASIKDYKERLAANRDCHDTLCEDDIITVRCPNGPKGEPHIFHLTRSALARSSTFQVFFDSEYYAPNTDMLISFNHYPAAVFDIIQRYLEQGPDRFNMTTLRVYLHRRYATRHRITLLVRLCGMAINMDLFYLHDMAFDILSDSTRFVNASMLPLLASFVFSSGVNYHSEVQTWCTTQVGRHFLQLKESDEWESVLENCDQVLNKEWDRMVAQNDDLLYSLKNHSDDLILAKMIRHMSYQEQDRLIAVLGEHVAHEKHRIRSKASSGEAVLSPIEKMHKSEDEDWSDVETPTSAGVPDRSSHETVVGVSEPRNSFSRSNEEETAKARQMLGMNSPQMPPRRAGKHRRSKNVMATLLGSPKTSPKKADN